MRTGGPSQGENIFGGAGDCCHGHTGNCHHTPFITHLPAWSVAVNLLCNHCYHLILPHPVDGDMLYLISTNNHPLYRRVTLYVTPPE